MNNNDVLRRMRYIFDFDDYTMIALFGLGQLTVTREQVSDWLKRDEDPESKILTDEQLASFLNGFIVQNRGKKDGLDPVPEKVLNNNIIFMKIKIAMNLQADEVLDMIALTGMKLSKHELSALFRKPGHKHYRECQDQILRNFLKGLQQLHRKNA